MQVNTLTREDKRGESIKGSDCFGVCGGVGEEGLL